MTKTNTQPIFKNLPSPVLGMVFFISLVSGLSLLGNGIKEIMTYYLAFFSDNLSLDQSYRLISYSLLHADLSHLGLNMLWLIIFGSAICRHFGFISLLMIFISGVIVGALIFLTFNETVLLIGASAGVSACCGAALRFMLRPAYDFNGRIEIYRLSDGRFLLPSCIFFVFDIINAILMAQMNYSIAWQSHIIGFVTGALLMSFPFINHNALYRAKAMSAEEEYSGD